MNNSSCSSIQMRIQREECFQNQLRFRIGKEPHYIQPKVNQNFQSEPDIMSQSEFNSSMAVPKFHSPTYDEEINLSQKNHKKKGIQLDEEFSCLDSQNQINLSSKIIFLNFIIWFCYFVGTIETKNNKISGFHIIDIIGNSLAIILISLQVYARMKISSVDQILHIWSIILTLAFILYPQNQNTDQILFQAIIILRTLRLVFPIFLYGGILSFSKKLLKLINRSKKIVFLIVVITFLVGFFGFQLFSNSLGNRCRHFQSDLFIDNWALIEDNRLCGQRSCSNSFVCRNQLQFGLQQPLMDKNMINFGYGLHSFDSSLDSSITIFQMFTMNSWGRISQMYFDVIPGWISVPILLIAFFTFRKFFISLIVIFFDMKKLKKQQIDMINGNGQRKIDSNKNMDEKKKTNPCQVSAEKRGESSKIMISQKSVTWNQQLKSSKFKIILMYGGVILLVITHLVLASQFGLNPQSIDTDLFNRKIGISMAIFFIFHFIGLGFFGYELLQSDDEHNQNINQLNTFQKIKPSNFGEKQVVSTVFNMQLLIFFTQLADYALRLFQRKYILEQTSGLTSLSHFLLSLRLFYIFLAIIEVFELKKLKNHLISCMVALKSIIKYVIIAVTLSGFLGAISHSIKDKNQQNGNSSIAEFFRQVNRFMMFLTNNSWHSLFRFSPQKQNMQPQSIYIQIVGTICVVFGTFIFIKYLISHIILESYWSQQVNNDYQESEGKDGDKQKSQTKSRKQIKSNKQNQPASIKTYKQFKIQKQENDQTRALKKQKSFFIFSYDNCLRQTAMSLIKNSYYKDVIRFRFYIVYVITNTISCLAFSSETYRIISIVLQGFILLDIIVQTIALRYFGEYSLTQNNLLPVLNTLSSLIIIILSSINIYIQFIPLLQIFRALVILDGFQSVKQTFDFVRTISHTIYTHFLILIPISFGYTLMILPAFSTQHVQSFFFSNLFQCFKLSLSIICQKGWNFDLIFGTQKFHLLSSQMTLLIMLVTWLMVSISLFYSLAGIFISKLVKQKRQKQNEIKNQLCNSNSLLEDYKIKQKILKIKPKFDYQLYGSGPLFKICINKIFKYLKITTCLISACCFLVLNTRFSQNQRLAVYGVHLFSFTAELLIFMTESIAFNQGQEYYLRDLILNIIAIPGAYIGFVNPVQYSSQPEQLKIILLLLNALTVIRFIKIVNYIPLFNGVYQFLRQKLSQTLNILFAAMICTLSISLYLFLILQKNYSIVQCINYVFLGIFGGDFYPAIQELIKRHDFQFTYQTHLLYLMVHLFNICFQNLFIAYAIFQLSENVTERMPYAHTQYNLFNFHQYFHENQFLTQWKKIDPQAKGFANFRLILNKSHLFIQNFSITPLPYRSYSNRVQTFKKLKLQIYESETIIKKEEEAKPQVKKQYVVTFHDFLYRLSRFAFKEMSSSKLIYKDGYFKRNFTFTDQPISIINISSEEKTELISKFSRKVDKRQQKQKQCQQEWKKQSLKQTKNNIKQQQQQNPDIQGLDCVLRATKITSQQVYSAYRLRRRIIKNLQEIRQKNQHKRNEQVKHYRSRQMV